MRNPAEGVARRAAAIVLAAQHDPRGPLVLASDNALQLLVSFKRHHQAERGSLASYPPPGLGPRVSPHGYLRPSAAIRKDSHCGLAASRPTGFVPLASRAADIRTRPPA